MRRLRVALLLLGLALAVPVMLLVARAREGERLEREMRHQAVAARAFDEMERQLTAVLEREEARPFEAYRRLASGEPEAVAAVPEFVIGHFQIDPDGRLHARPGTDVGALAREALANGFDGPRRGAAPATTLLRSELEDFVAVGKAKAPAPPSDDAYDVISRLNLGGASRAERKQQVRQEPISKLYGQQAEAVYDQQVEARARKQAEASLEQRAEAAARRYAETAVDRQLEAAESKQDFARYAAEAGRDEPSRGTALAPPPPAPRAAPPEERLPVSGVRSSNALFDRMAAEATAPTFEPELAEELAETEGGGLAAEEDLLGAKDERDPSAHELARADADSAPSAQAFAGIGDAPARPPPDTEGRVRVALDPMMGLPVAGDRLLLVRTALVDELGYRQGALLDRRALAVWLEGQVLARQGLGGLALLRFDVPAEATSWAPADHMVFGHRFAEPFDAMAAQLALAPLPTRSGSSVFSIYALAGLLALVAAGGLLAVDRMVKVVVSFAERRSRFVASVSHELKTPLTAIRMYAEMLRDGLVRDEAKREEYYGTITDESERLSRLIDNVLEFSKLERGQREIELAVGAIPDVLEEAASKLRPHVERQGFTLRIAAEPGLPAVRFDRDALLQVLFNLVDNAMKYARPAAPAEVVLEARAEGERVLVGVRDYGPGVDRRHLGRIFEPFYRVEAELTRSAKGTGIGLALVKELGQAMGAAVSGTNAEGGGFRVLLAFEPASG